MDYFDQPRCIQYSGDIRIYLKEHDVLLSLDGADAGVTVNYSDIEYQIKDMVDWFMSIALINLAVFLLWFPWRFVRRHLFHRQFLKKQSSKNLGP